MNLGDVYISVTNKYIKVYTITEKLGWHWGYDKVVFDGKNMIKTKYIYTKWQYINSEDIDGFKNNKQHFKDFKQDNIAYNKIALMLLL